MSNLIQNQERIHKFKLQLQYYSVLQQNQFKMFYTLCSMHLIKVSLLTPFLAIIAIM